MRFGENLRNLRIARGYTQERLAKMLGSSQASITSWENETREPDFQTIRKLATFFNVPMSALLPSDDTAPEDYAIKVADQLHQNPKLKLVFDRSRFLSDQDLDAVLGILSALQKERDSFE